jgi:polyhydroxyalkanoate synthesis regulator phasin
MDDVPDNPRTGEDRPADGGVAETLRSAVERTMRATAGSAADSRERAAELFDDVVRRGREAREELARRGQEAGVELARRGQEATGEVGRRLAELETRLAELEARLAAEPEGPAEPSAPAEPGTDASTIPQPKPEG